MKPKYTPKFRKGDIITGKNDKDFGIVLGEVDRVSQEYFFIRIIRHSESSDIGKVIKCDIKVVDSIMTHYSIADTKINRKLYPNGKAWNGEWRLCSN